MSHMHPDRQQIISQESYGRQQYKLPPTAAPSPPSRSSRNSLPSDSSAGPTAGRDNGWASRTPRSSSHVIHPSAASPPPVPPHVPSSVERAASDPVSAQTTWSNYTLAPVPSTSLTPYQTITADPRRPHSPTASVPLPQDFPSEERKLEFLLRTTEERITSDRTLARRWTRHDSDILQKLVAEHQVLGAGYSMRVRTMDTALNSFVICIDCYRAKRVDVDAEATIDSLREGVQGIIIDLCEDAKTYVRKRAYPALLRMSQTDLTLVKHHSSILVQLLQNDGDGELALVQDILAQHLELSLSDWLEVAIDDGCFGDLRGLILAFFRSDAGQRALQTIIDNGLREAELARHLAPILPLASRHQYKAITSILHSLQNIWPDADEERSLEERKAARDAGAAVLWNLCLVLMGQSKTFVSGPPDAPLLTFKTFELLKRMQPQSNGLTIAGGAALFNDLVKLSLGMEVPECDQALNRITKPSEAKLFLSELEVSARYFFCFIQRGGSGEGSAPTDTDTALHHLRPIERIAFFRSAANLAAKVASAAKESPSDLSYPGESTAKEIAQVTTQALMTHVPISSPNIRGSSDATGTSRGSEAHDAYAMLAAEALLVAIHLCETYLLTLPNGSAMVTNDPKVRDRVRTLTALAADLERLQKSPTEVLEAAKVVRALGNAYFKVRSRMNTHFPPPEWLMPPPPFPAWQSPELETPKEPAASGRRGSRGQKRSSDNGSTQERRVRGRGAVRADDDFDADARNVKVDPEPSDLLRPDTGITIRGASQAESRVPKWEPDVYRPESSLFARLDRRDDEPRYGGMGSHAPRDYSGSYASSLYHSGGDDYGYHSYHRHDEYASYGSHSYPHDEPRYRNDDPRGASSWGYSRR